ncbi:hypothetical protein MKEN_00752700 [Mycena kentingensis (nom. inval.)]|nr:hypothetical protein MKEN_00752700 [Mycena kentingensis (nom. inval.)]
MIPSPSKSAGRPTALAARPPSRRTSSSRTSGRLCGSNSPGTLATTPSPSPRLMRPASLSTVASTPAGYSSTRI